MKPYWLILLLMISFSCSKESDPYVHPIDSTIRIDVDDLLDSASQSIILKCETIKEYHCTGFELKYRLVTEGYQIKLDFTHIYEHQGCFDQITPAHADIDLGDLKDGYYDFEITINRKLSSGWLIVRGKEISARFNSHIGFSII